MAPELEIAAAWSSAYITALPDSAFACVDDSGRHYPHHNAEGALDLPHLRNALSRLAQEATTTCGADHIRAHAREAGIGEQQAEGMQYENARDLWPDVDMELQAEGGSGLHFSGMAAVYNVPSQPRPPFGHTIFLREGTFTKTLKDGRPKKMFLNHNDDIVLVSTAGGTLRLSEDKHGLRVDADLPDNAWGRPVADAIRRGDIDSMSIGYEVPRDRDRWNEQRTEREILEAKLYEVSPITAWPGFVQTSVSIQSMLTGARGLARIMTILGSPDGELDDEQLALLNDSIARHRHGPTPAEVRAEWAERFAL